MTEYVEYFTQIYVNGFDENGEKKTLAIPVKLTIEYEKEKYIVELTGNNSQIHFKIDLPRETGKVGISI